MIRWLMFLALALAAPAQAAAPVWVVHSGAAEITLFGSVHALPKGVAWRSARLNRALARADSLWFEIPLDVASQIRGIQSERLRGALPIGQHLSSFLSPEDQRQLAQAEAKVSAAPSDIDLMQPWLANLTLTRLFYYAQGLKADDGVEWTLNRSAPAHTPRHALETIDFQQSVFAAGSREEQLANLRVAFAEINQGDIHMERLVSAWASGDVSSLTKQILAEAQPNEGADMHSNDRALYDRFLVRRNTAWVATLRQQLRLGKRAVVVVGAAHLVGPDSVIAQLKAAGYKVEGPFTD
jgi:uncharacterized protein